jgi:hypothetical protein
MDGSATRELWRLARSNVLVINPDAPGKLVADDGYVTTTPAG